MPGLDVMELQRLRYRQGQMLLSQDFRDEASFTAQRRWWHNRALHQAFGIVDGFQVQPGLQPPGNFVKVSRGLAYDCFGRELISQREQRIEIPPSAKSEAQMLLVRYRDAPAFQPGVDLMEACLPDTCSLFEERPDFFWRPAAQVRPQDGVPLARVTFDGSNVQLDSTFHASAARPLARPLIANGATIAGATPWEVWSIPFSERLVPIGLQVRIDTSRAGFTDVPRYLGWLQIPSLDVTAANILPLGLIGLHAEHVMETTDNGFTFRLFLPLFFVFISQLVSGGPNLFAAIGAFLLGFAQKQQLYVCWLGVQSQPSPAQNSE